MWELLILSTLSKQPGTVVLFSGPWCGACVAMEPVWKRFVAEYRGPLRLVYVNVDQPESEAYRRYAPLWESDRQMPQVCWLDGRGRLCERRPGLVTLEQLRQRSGQVWPVQNGKATPQDF